MGEATAGICHFSPLIGRDTIAAKVVRVPRHDGHDSGLMADSIPE
jgi:hypothetical protein